MNVHEFFFYYFREYAKHVSTKANLIIDNLLSKSKEHIAEKNRTKLALKDLSKTIRSQGNDGEVFGNFVAKNGFITDMSQLKRRADFTVVEEEQQLTLFGTLYVGDSFNVSFLKFFFNSFFKSINYFSLFHSVCLR